jgi:hypothetical protein
MKAHLHDISFEDLEVLVFRLVLEIVRRALAGILEDLDNYLLVVRDRNRYQVEDLEERVIDSLLGPVRFRRRSYRDLVKGERVYLLDEKLGLRPYQRVSGGLAKVAVALAAAGPSYRGARDRIGELMGERLISHEGIRQMVLKTGQVIASSPGPEAVVKKSGVVFIEADGLWSAKQGKKSKAGRGRRRKEEVRLAVVHEGWRPRYPGSREHETILLFKHLQTRGTTAEFWEEVYAKLGESHDLEKTLVVINGDGAEWIRKGQDYFPRALYQYDRFHVAREVQKGLRRDQDLSQKAAQALRDNDLDRLILLIEEAIEVADKTKRRELEALKNLVVTNREFILDYRIRLAALGYTCQGFRGLGSGESNVGKFKARIRGRSWSRDGLWALANVLFKLLQGNLGLYTQMVNSRLERAREKAVASAAQVVRQAVGASEPAVRKGHFSCLDRGTDGYAQLFRQILREGFSLY